MRSVPHELYQFHLEPLEAVRVPPYLGSALRGLFGRAFRRVVCALRQERCPTCLVRDTCTYQRVFESRVDPARGPRPGVDVAPHPYVLVPPLSDRLEYRPGDRITCQVLLMGPALGILPYLVYTFQELGRLGLSRDRKPLALRSVEALAETGWTEVFRDGAEGLSEVRTVAPAPLVPDLGEWVRVRLATPLRLKRRGRLVRDLDVETFLVSLGRRWSHLERFYGQGEEEGDAFGDLLRLRDRLDLAARTRWHDWTRYSSRQSTKMQLGGLVGELELRGDVGPLAPWLAWAGRFHLGKATSFGLGKIDLEHGADDNQQTRVTGGF